MIDQQTVRPNNDPKIEFLKEFIPAMWDFWNKNIPSNQSTRFWDWFYKTFPEIKSGDVWWAGF